MMWVKAVGLVVVVGGAFAAAAAYAAFGAFLPWREEEEASRLARVAGVRAGHVVAEIGAGTGRFTVAMATRVGAGGKVYATELDPERRRAIGERARAAGLTNVTVVEAAADATNLPDACCDVVFLRNVYHHIREPEPFVASIARAARADGVVIVIDFEPGGLWLHGGSPTEGARRPGHGVARADAIAEFRAAGFVPRTELPRWSGPMWMVAFSRPEHPQALAPPEDGTGPR